MEFLRNNRLEVKMLVPNRVACYSICVVDLILISFLLVNHSLEFSSCIQNQYFNVVSLCYIIDSGVNLLLALLLLIGVYNNNLLNCQLYIILWVPSSLCIVALYIIFLVYFLPLHSYHSKTGQISPFYIQLITYPLLVLVYKPLSIFLVRKFILHIIRGHRSRQDSKLEGNKGKAQNKNENGHGNGGVSTSGLHLSPLGGGVGGITASPLMGHAQPPPFGYRSMGRRGRDSEIFERVPGVDDLLHEIEFPMENHVSSDEFQIITDEPILTMDHDFFVRRGYLTVNEGPPPPYHQQAHPHAQPRPPVGGSFKQKKIPVAIKIFRQNVDVEAVRRMLLETKILTMFSNHNNVIKLLGFCTENIHKGKMTLLLEYCEKGRLGDFLKKNYTQFQDLIIHDKFCMPPPAEDAITPVPNRENIYENLIGSSICLSASRDFKFNSRTLLNWAFQIANGMEFINDSGVIHGNLLAQNCIVDDRNRIRISNFTFATQLSHNKQTQHPIDFTKMELPWRYMAIECMNTDPPTPSAFTDKSDVWSYGVVLWEMFSLGCQPYEGLTTSEFFPKLLEGERLEKPAFANSQVYKIMQDCWHISPGKRPTFTQLKLAYADILQNFMQ